MSKKIRKIYVIHKMIINVCGSEIHTDTSTCTTSNIEDAIKTINDSAEIFEESVDDVVHVYDEPTHKIIIAKDVNYLDIHAFRAFIEVIYI